MRSVVNLVTNTQTNIYFRYSQVRGYRSTLPHPKTNLTFEVVKRKLVASSCLNVHMLHGIVAAIIRVLTSGDIVIDDALV